MRSHLFSMMIPELLEEISNKGKEERLGYKYIQTCTYKPPSHITVTILIHAHKFSYLAKGKSSMFDGHECKK